MGNLCTSEKTEESSFGFAFNNYKFSDRTLKLEILPPDQDDLDSEPNSNWKEQTFHTNSALLAARSPFFRKLLDNGMKESQDKAEFTLRIKASEEAAVIDLLSFIYDKPMKASSETELLDVLIVADKYEVSSCIQHCIQMLGKFPMTVESALFYLELPSIVFMPDQVKPLLDQVKKYLASHFKNFTESPAAMELPLYAVEAVLGGNDLQVVSEDNVFDFVLRWARRHYPNLEERREILTNRLAPLICFHNMSCSKLKSNATCPDFDHEQISELVINALSSKVESPYGKSACRRRVYYNRLVKVVHFELAQPRCVVYFDITKEDCAGLVPSKQLYSQTFCLGGESFNLSAKHKLETDRLHVYLNKKGGSETCTLDMEISVMMKISKKFEVMIQFVKDLERGTGWGCVLETPWKDFLAEYFIDDIFHLRADVTFIK